LKSRRLALGNGLTRRPEAYHERVRAATATASGTDTPSIHDLVAAKEEGLERYLAYDAYRRLSLVDHFLGREATLGDFERGSHPEVGDFPGQPYQTALGGNASERTVSLRRSATVWADGAPHRVAVEKRVRLASEGARVRVSYLLECLEDAPLPVWFGVEWNLSMLGGDSPEHRYRIPRPEGGHEDASFNSRGETPRVREIGLEDRWRGFRVNLRWSRPALLWRAPVETISLSESGFERLYQSSALLPTWRFPLEAGKPVELEFELEITGP
jgi:alpha-amylase